ncbi:MAG: hypothetical protein LZ168_07530 [Thaumarchaeota archaeon]|nr:hypothetical protein [Candidatus Geocrenenecus arthurdayi]
MKQMIEIPDNVDTWKTQSVENYELTITVVGNLRITIKLKRKYYTAEKVY